MAVLAILTDRLCQPSKDKKKKQSTEILVVLGSNNVLKSLPGDLRTCFSFLNSNHEKDVNRKQFEIQTYLLFGE